MGKFDNISDEELIARLRDGETIIEDYLMEKYKGLVRQKARAMFLIGGDTDDLIQEGMIGLFKAVRDFQPGREATFATFARMCIDRQIYSAIQNSNRQKHLPLNSYVSLNQKDESSPIWELSVENPEEIIIDQETTRDLQQKISDYLSPMENKVLDLYLKGEGYVEIGRILGKSPKSIDNALQRIRAKIREVISQNRK
ncbi:rNA polymerase sigma 30 subunit SigH [Ruminococcus sp. CAG:60]|nr:rNA polymerase sigma 30 subunit SigH [Ruminococcus sp. CAG:60]